MPLYRILVIWYIHIYIICFFPMLAAYASSPALVGGILLGVTGLCILFTVLIVKNIL